jgi:hypothetical protein
MGTFRQHNKEKKRNIYLRSVADPGCLTRIPDPDFYPSRVPDLRSRIPDLGSRIPDPKTATKGRDEKKKNFQTFFVATNLLTAQEKKFGTFHPKSCH